MTLFDPPAGAASDDGRDVRTWEEAEPIKRPARWSPSNWPVRWKVLAIALAPMVLAVVFGGLRIAGAVSDTRQLQLGADRAELAPAIADYMAALGNAWVAAADGGEPQRGRQATAVYDGRAFELRRLLADTDLAADVRSAVATVLDDGRALLEKVSAHDVALDRQVTGYAPILLTAEGAIVGSVRVGGEHLRSRAQGLSRAVGVRGQMTMQRVLVHGGGELSEPTLRTAMVALAGTEPSTLSGVSQLLGVGSPEANALQQQYVRRMAVIADPTVTVAGNPELLVSIANTDEIANRVIDDAAEAVTAQVRGQATDRRNAAIRDALAVAAAMIGALAIVVVVARSLVRPLRILRDGALNVAHRDLGEGIARVRHGDEREPRPLPVYTTEEVGQVAHAVDELHAQALLLAGDETRLRLLVNDMFETMSRRNRSLVDQQLSLIDRLERSEDDPDRLDSLFRLDHLAARMRRNGANLLVLAEAQTGGEQGRPAPLSTVLEAAVAEVEDYRRVEIVRVPEITVAGAVTGDAVHLLAELIDNALRYSPPTAPVTVAAARTEDGGVRVGVGDTGLGMTDTGLRLANTRLRAGGELSPENTRHMGLFVVGRLARRHGMRVRLRAAVVGGIIAEVYVPPSLLVDVAAERPEPPCDEPSAVVGGETILAASRAAAETSADSGELFGSLPRRILGSGGGDTTHDAQRPDPVAEGASTHPADDVIYQRMLSEALTDPHEISRSADLDWKSVWDHGWSVAAEAEQVQVAAHTDRGLPVRDPGARLVPGAATPTTGEHPDTTGSGQHRRRDPDAVRTSFNSHFGGVRAGRSHAQHRDEGIEQ